MSSVDLPKNTIICCRTTGVGLVVRMNTGCRTCGRRASGCRASGCRTVRLNIVACCRTSGRRTVRLKDYWGKTKKGCRTSGRRTSGCRTKKL